MQSFRRLIAAFACVIVGAASFALSYVALRDVAAALQAVPADLAWIVPIVIDGGVICGSAVIWSHSKEAARRPVFPFLFVASLVAISVLVNVNHAGPSPLAKLIAGLPPLILLGTLELVAAQGRKILPVKAAETVLAPVAQVPVAASAPAAPQPMETDTRVEAPAPAPVLEPAAAAFHVVPSVSLPDGQGATEVVAHDTPVRATARQESVLPRPARSPGRPESVRRPTRVRAAAAESA